MCIRDRLKANPSLEAAYITAPPRMAHYIEYSTKIYNIYLKYVAPEDIHAVSYTHLDVYKRQAYAGLKAYAVFNLQKIVIMYSF